MSKEVYAGIYLVVATVVAMFLFKSLGKKNRLGTAVVSLFTFTLTTLLGYVLYLATDNYYLMRIGLVITYASVDWCLCFLNVFALYYTGARVKYRVITIGVPVALVFDNILFAVYYMRGFADQFIEYTDEGMAFATFKQTPVMDVHFFICYVLLASAVVNFMYYSFKISRTYKAQYHMLALLCILFGIADTLIRGLELNIDLTLFIYPIMSCFIFFYVYVYKGAGIKNSAKAVFVEEMNMPMVLFDYNGYLLMMNKRAREIFNADDDCTEAEFIKANPYIDLEDEKSEHEFETSFEVNNVLCYFNVSYKYLQDRRGMKVGTMYLFEDITEKKKALILADFNATHDSLTGTFNRNYLYDFKKIAGERGTFPMYIALYAVNELYNINELYGMEIGDKALCRMAWLLQQYSGALDIVIRTNGNEMLLAFVSTSERKAKEILKRIDKRIAGFEVEDVSVSARGVNFVINDISEFDREYHEAQERLAGELNEAEGIFRLM